MQERNSAFFVLLILTGVFGAGCAGQAPPALPGPAPAITPEPATTLAVITNQIPVPTNVPAPVPTPAITTRRTPVITGTPLQLISDSALKAQIQDAKNKLDLLKNTDRADTILITAKKPGECDVKLSKELGYLIDANTGEITFVKGDYGSISLDRFRPNMRTGHSYVILHSHTNDWIVCQGTGTIGLNTLSLGDLAASANLSRQGYHILKIIAVSDNDYEIYPRIPDNWKTGDEISNSFARIEKRLEATFHYDYYDENGKKQTWYDVDMIMPLLAKDLDYTYVINSIVVP